MTAYDCSKAASELREQISSSRRRIGFFLGAGSSMSAGLQGIVELTDSVEKMLEKGQRARFLQIKESLSGSPNVEDILNKVRLYRELLSNSSKKEQDGLSSGDAKDLDLEICKAITGLVNVDPPSGLDCQLRFARWIYALHSEREDPVEVFTTNYDLLIERSFEEAGVPYFDGFVGSVQPFFSASSVEAEKSVQTGSPYPPVLWTRLWKLHGSVGWHLIKVPDGSARVVRRNDIVGPTEQLMIFPSRDKYSESRKLPFLTFQDHLRKFLSRGEVVLLISGYSFSDEHLNEIILEGLRGNSRLAITALMYCDYLSSDKAAQYAKEHPNFTICWPDKVMVGGVLFDWSYTATPAGGGREKFFWNENKSRWMLGDFGSLSFYLESFTRT
jgi:hypothetical protein